MASNLHSDEGNEALKRIKKELKDWERGFQKSNGNPPQKEDIRASPAIHALYREYANLKAQQNTDCHIQKKTQTRSALHDNETHVQTKVVSGDTQTFKEESDSEASDSSHISATPPRKQLAMSSGLSSSKNEKGLLDVLGKTLSKIRKSNTVAGRLENDDIFLAEKNHNLQIHRKGSKKAPYRNPEKHSKKHLEPTIKSSERLNDGDASLCSLRFLELGFSIKVQQPGRHAEEGMSIADASEKVRPGFFSSCTPSSIVKPACRSILRRSGFQDSQQEPRLQGPFPKVNASMDIDESGFTEVMSNNNPESYESNKQMEQKYAASLASKLSGVTGETPDLPMPKEKNTKDQNFANADKDLLWSKRDKCTEQPLKGLNSWTNPKVLKKAGKKHQNMIIASKKGTASKSFDLSKKRSQGGNFVKLNLNGKGSRLRRFVNKGSKRKAISSDQTLYRRKRMKKGNGNGGNDLLHEEDSAEIIDMDENGNLKKKFQKQSVRGQTWQSSGKTERSEKASGECKYNQIKRQHSYDPAELKEAAESAVREQSDQSILNLLKISHGFDSFRSGQLETIKRIMANQSTMLVSPTGSGKSLCYQLPALVLPGLTLVISPLVALMVDQLQHLPPMISGSLLASSQKGKEIAETLDQLCSGALKVLFVSPERLLNDNFLSILESIPLISLVVVDEAHCLSEWSHNFRPSYFRLGTILRKRLNVQCILAMTATATKKTLQSILRSLEILPGDVVQVSHTRENLQLSVSLTENKLKDLLLLLKVSPFQEARSIIVYCKFQSETDTVSKFLRDSSIPAKSYHSGLTAKDRSHIQEMFCSNKLRVVVATIAFGMGLDKSDVEAVIHYSLPGSLEHYVQETGRAGRDGRLAYCHLFLDDNTYFKIRSLAYSDGADEYAINKFLCEVFAYKDRPSQVSSLNIATASRNFDLKEEVMDTILIYLEIEEVQYLRMLSQLNATCSLYFHKSSPTLLAKKSILIDAVLKRIQSKHGQHVFDIPTVANDSGLEITYVLKELEKLQFLGEISYDLKDPAFCYICLKVPENICSLAKIIASRLAEVEISKVQKIDAMYTAAMNAAKKSKQFDSCGVSLQQSFLQRITEEYFNSENCLNEPLSHSIQVSSPFLRADIKVLLQSNAHVSFTPRAVARIMHGISSPAYPLAVWSKNHFWGRYQKVDFNVVKESATSELVAFRGRSRNLVQ